MHSKLSKFDHPQSRATEQWIGFVESSVAEGNVILFFVWFFFDGSQRLFWEDDFADTIGEIKGFIVCF